VEVYSHLSYSIGKSSAWEVGSLWFHGKLIYEAISVSCLAFLDSNGYIVNRRLQHHRLLPI
jgi:hypothetical protein